MNNFLSTNGDTKKKLVQLKSKVEALLGSINKSLELCEKNEGSSLPTVETVKSNIERESSQLRKAIDKRDTAYIIDLIKNRNVLPKINESGKSLIESKELEVLNESLKELSLKCETYFNKEIKYIKD